MAGDRYPVHSMLITQATAIERMVALVTDFIPRKPLKTLRATYLWRSTLNITDLPFGVTDWSEVKQTEHSGENGVAYWKTRNFGDIRVRMVEYSPGYLADHWCAKGHILLCLEGELHTELDDGRCFVLTPGSSYQVADNAELHRSSTKQGAKLFVVD